MLKKVDGDELVMLTEETGVFFYQGSYEFYLPPFFYTET